MKKSGLFVLLLAPLVLISCGVNTAKSVSSLTDFLSASDVASLKIAATSVKTATGSSSAGQTSSSTSQAAVSSTSSSSETTSSHSANLYANEDFVITNGTDNYIGFSKAYGSINQYFLINASKKTGFVTNDATTLDEKRAATKALLSKDYSDLAAVYDLMKTYVGKSAKDFENMTSLSLTMSVNGDVAGYTLLTTTKENEKSIETRYYLTLDRFDSGWAFTNYSKRVTTTSKTSKGATVDYAVAEYTVSVVSAYSSFSLSLSAYSLYLKDAGAKDVTFTDGIPLTAK
jgi:hypothetical protein